VSAPFALAKVTRYAIADARILPGGLAGEPLPLDRDGFARADIVIAEGRIAAIAPAGSQRLSDLPRLALAGRIALPAFIDAHTHLDKGHIWRRAPNPTGAFAEALKTVIEDRRANWNAVDVARRMDFALRSAYARGTRAIRTHIDSVGPQTRISWPVFAEARERWRGRIDLQASPLFAIDYVFDDAHMADVEAMVEAHGSNILGAVTYMAPRLREGIDRLFALAQRKEWDLDFHVDETADPAACSLDAIAAATLDHRFEGRVLVGHCCSLARRDESEMSRAIDLVARAGLAVVSLPLCNMFLQDRGVGRTPRWRGVTALHELKAAGVPVMIASDNTRDSFYAYGDLDMLEVWRESVRILHLDYPFAAWTPAVFAAPAAAMGVEPGALRVGAPADMILTRARDFTELFARPHSDRVVLRGGRPVAETAPEFAELDDLEGLAP
jgi:cytosine/creatinine deaminase